MPIRSLVILLAFACAFTNALPVNAANAGRLLAASLGEVAGQYERTDQIVNTATLENMSEENTIDVQAPTMPKMSDGGNPYGHYSGDRFDDYQTHASKGIRSIQAWSGNIINGIKVTYSDGSTRSHGHTGNDGLENEIFEIRDSYITKVHLRSGNIVNQLQFELADGRKSQVWGKGGGKPHLFTAPSGSAVVSFFGFSGNALDQIGFYTEPWDNDVPSFSKYTGKWIRRGSGTGSLKYTEATSWSKSEVDTTGKSFKNGLSVTESIEFGGEFGVPKASMSLTVSQETTVSAEHSLQTTLGGETTHECTSVPCEDGNIFQWLTEATASDGKTQSVSSCDFACVTDLLDPDTHAPKCPKGHCVSETQCQCCNKGWSTNHTLNQQLLHKSLGGDCEFDPY